MNIFILSKFFTKPVYSKLKKVLNIEDNQIRILFCATAAYESEEIDPLEKDFVRYSIGELSDYGFKIDFIDLTKYKDKSEELYKLYK